MSGAWGRRNGDIVGRAREGDRPDGPQGKIHQKARHGSGGAGGFLPEEKEMIRGRIAPLIIPGPQKIGLRSKP